MAGKDISEKKLLRYEDEFAIAANLSLFQNRPVIKPENLIMKETWSDYTEGIDAKEQDRDVLAEAKYISDDNEMRIVILGIENQTKIDPRMILRVYGYDGAAYRSQLNAAQVNPVVTIVFNYSDEKWPEDKKSLYALLKPDEGLKPFINDYRLNVIDLQFLDEKVLQALEGGFGEIVRFVASKDKKNFRFRDGIRLEHLDAVRQTLYELTKDPRYTAAVVNKKGKEAVNMCEYMDYVNSQAKAEGQLMIVHELIEEKGYTYEQAADLMKISVEEFAGKYEAFLKAQNQPEQAAEN